MGARASDTMFSARRAGSPKELSVLCIRMAKNKLESDKNLSRGVLKNHSIINDYNGL